MWLSIDFLIDINIVLPVSFEYGDFAHVLSHLPKCLVLDFCEHPRIGEPRYAIVRQQPEDHQIWQSQYLNGNGKYNHSDDNLLGFFLALDSHYIDVVSVGYQGKLVSFNEWLGDLFGRHVLYSWVGLVMFGGVFGAVGRCDWLLEVVLASGQVEHVERDASHEEERGEEEQEWQYWVAEQVDEHEVGVGGG